MNIEDLENDIIEWREDYNEPEYADLLQEMLNAFQYERNKEKFLELKEKHYNDFPTFQFPNCFNEDLLE